jgi:hypothetical protein
LILVSTIVSDNSHWFGETSRVQFTFPYEKCFGSLSLNDGFLGRFKIFALPGNKPNFLLFWSRVNLRSIARFLSGGTNSEIRLLENFLQSFLLVDESCIVDVERNALAAAVLPRLV